MQDNHIKASLLPRYVGNRIHVLFTLAGSLVMLREHLLSYCAVASAASSGSSRARPEKHGHPCAAASPWPHWQGLDWAMDGHILRQQRRQKKPGVSKRN